MKLIISPRGAASFVLEKESDYDLSSYEIAECCGAQSNERALNNIDFMVKYIKNNERPPEYPAFIMFYQKGLDPDEEYTRVVARYTVYFKPALALKDFQAVFVPVDWVKQKQ